MRFLGSAIVIGQGQEQNGEQDVHPESAFDVEKNFCQIHISRFIVAAHAITRPERKQHVRNADGIQLGFEMGYVRFAGNGQDNWLSCKKMFCTVGIPACLGCWLVFNAA